MEVINPCIYEEHFESIKEADWSPENLFGNYCQTH